MSLEFPKVRKPDTFKSLHDWIYKQDGWLSNGHWLVNLAELDKKTLAKFANYFDQQDGTKVGPSGCYDLSKFNTLRNMVPSLDNYYEAVVTTDAVMADNLRELSAVRLTDKETKSRGVWLSPTYLALLQSCDRIMMRTATKDSNGNLKHYPVIGLSNSGSIQAVVMPKRYDKMVLP